MNKMCHSFRSAIIFGLSLLLCSVEVFSQNYFIKGTITDNQASQPLIGVTVTLSNTNDTIIKLYAITDSIGRFIIRNANEQAYKLTTHYIGYKTFEKTVNIKNRFENLGIIQLVPEKIQIKEVIVLGQTASSVQRGDTTEMNANAFKTSRDASAEELVQKMPTVSLDNSGNIKAQGETVQKVLVDGKPFFGDDPTTSLRNLPAEVVDKVQIYNELSEQSKLTGFDDGNTTKTMNIVTRKNNRNGVFGKMFAGAGSDYHYQASETLNLFNGDRRISIIGMSNNINQQNFASSDLQGIGGGGGRGGNNFMVGPQSGITKTNSIGLNYSDNWGAKIKVSSSYFFNNTDNHLQKKSLRTYFNNDTINKNDTIEKAMRVALDTSENKQFNHRFNMRFEYNIDSMNTLVIIPRLSIQQSQSSSFSNKNDWFAGITNNRNNSNSTGYNFGNNLTYRRKFFTKGRSISLNINTSGSYKQPVSNQDADSVGRLNNKRVLYSSTNKNNTTENASISSNIMYTEPLGTLGLLQLNYNTSYSNNATDLVTKNKLLGGNPIDTSLSNKYESNYVTNSAGLGYRLQTTKLNGSVTVNFQQAQLIGKIFKHNAKNIEKTFRNVLPMANIRYKFSDKNQISVNYRTSTNSPGINQLQNVVDVSSLPDLSIGNPDLVQEYSHNLNTRISFANPDKSTNFFIFIRGNYTLDPVGTSQFRSVVDSLYINGILLKKGARVDSLINFDHSWQFNTFLNYGFPLRFIKSNLNFNTGITYSQMPGRIDRKMTYTNKLEINPGIVLSSNVSENLDFTLAYFGGFNQSKSSFGQSGNNEYYSHSVNFKFNWIFWKGIVLTNDITDQYYIGLSSKDYNQKYILWNMGLGKKLFASQRGEIKLSVFDILNQNDVVSRNVTASYIDDSRSNVLKRYVMFTFTYNLRQFSGNQNDDANRHRDDMHFDRPPGDRPPGGGPPPGVDRF